MSYIRCKVIISEIEPIAEIVEVIEGEPPVETGFAGVNMGFLWFKPSDNAFYKVISSNPLTWGNVIFNGDFGDVNFLGDIKADGHSGINENKVIGGYRMKFKQGILIECTPV